MVKILYYLLFLTIFICVAINLSANKIIFYPVKEYWPHQLPFEEVSFLSPSGAEVHAIYLPPAEFMDTILFFHGNAGNVSYFEDFAKTYRKYGYGFLIFDYPGFGKTRGRLTQANIYADSLAAANYLIKEKKTAPGNIILWGYSFGNAPAVNTAVAMSDVPFKALILQSPFTNIPQMAAALAGGGYNPQSTLQKVITGALYAALFNKHYDNLDKIGKVKVPVLIGYSKQDSLIPWKMSEALAAAAPEGAKTFASPWGKHDDFDWFEKEAAGFLKALR